MIKLKPPAFWLSKNWLAKLLMPISWIYMFLGYLRSLYIKQIKLPQTVICVGNITLGGAGKTQLVAKLATILLKHKISLVIVTKAYRGKIKKAKLIKKFTSLNHEDAKELGDESVLLSKFGDVIAAKKLKYSLKLIKKLNPQIVILDDGMQNPLLYKDLQILVLSPDQHFTNQYIFPSGNLRQTLSSALNKSDIICMIGQNIDQQSSLLNQVKLSKKPFFTASTKIVSKINKQNKYIAFAGIGNPTKFYSLLKLNNLQIVKSISFPDHHDYSKNDLQKLVTLAKKKDAILITTEKDYIKLPEQYKNKIIYTKITLNINNENEFTNLIYEKIL